MTELIRTLYVAQWRGWVALVTVVLSLVFAAFLFPRASRKTGSCENNVRDLQMAYRASRFKDVLLGWSKNSGRADAVGVMKRENIIKLDLLFPVIYSLALAFSYACARGDRRPGALDLLVFTLPLVAGLLDYVENSLHLHLLWGINTESEVDAANFSPAAVFVASACARLKYLLVFATALAVIVAVVGRLRSES